MSCAVAGCGAEVFVGKLCSRHYNRLRTTGTTDDGPKARASLAERLWRQVDRRQDDECWPWISKSRTQGYGTIGRSGRNGKKVLAHRAAWEVTYGQIPSGDGYHGTVVMHTCDNRLCCNPAHLRVGTQTENVADMDAKGRRITVSKMGASHHNAKLTEDDVRAIRADTRSGSQVAADYGITKENVYYIKNRKAWKHI